MENTVDALFEDYKGRRLGFIKALTSDVDKFFLQCDPGDIVVKHSKMQLFEKINELPTVYEVVSRNATPSKDQSSNCNSSTSKSSGTSDQPKAKEEEESEKEGENEEEATLCGACGGSYASHEFWICCDMCERWFHGNCVKITPAKAEGIKQYKCPFCINNKKVKI